MPHEECEKIRRSAFEESSYHEGEESGQKQKNNDEYVCDRRREIGAQFSAGDRPDGFHLSEGLSVSGNVIDLNTSSSRPSSTFRCAICQFCLCARANSSGSKFSLGWSRMVVLPFVSEISSALSKECSAPSSFWTVDQPAPSSPSTTVPACGACVFNSFGVPFATIFPRSIMIARVHAASTSSRMCVEKIIALSRPISRIRARTSCF